MIEVLRTLESDEGDWVEAALRDLVLDYQRVLIAPEDVGGIQLPAIRQDGKLVYGREDLLAYLKELEEFVEDWRRFQSDACYVDGDGDCY